jgi:hypothetical protein
MFVRPLNEDLHTLPPCTRDTTRALGYGNRDFWPMLTVVRPSLSHDKKSPSGRAHPTHNAQDAASAIQDQVAGMSAADQAALLQTLTAALSKSVAGDKGGKR